MGWKMRNGTVWQGGFSPFCIMHDIEQGGYYTFDDKIYLTLDQKSDTPLPRSITRRLMIGSQTQS